MTFAPLGSQDPSQYRMTWTIMLVLAPPMLQSYTPIACRPLVLSHYVSYSVSYYGKQAIVAGN